MSRSLAAVIVAGGTGDRFGRPGGKQLAALAGAPVLSWSVRAFAAADAVCRIVVVTHPDRIEEYRAAVESSVRAGIHVLFVPGGDTRQESVSSGLSVLAGDEYVAVHDGARPLVTAKLIDSAVRTLADSNADGVVVGHPCVDTVKVVDDVTVRTTPSRSTLWTAQTPQIFRRGPLLSAYESADRDGFEGTDDASLVERSGGIVIMYEGPRWNMKVTHSKDLLVAEALMREVIADE